MQLFQPDRIPESLEDALPGFKAFAEKHGRAVPDIEVQRVAMLIGMLADVGDIHTNAKAFTDLAMVGWFAFLLGKFEAMQ